LLPKQTEEETNGRQMQSPVTQNWTHKQNKRRREIFMPDFDVAYWGGQSWGKCGKEG